MRLHGDPHTGNMLRPSSDLVILDLETVCTGPLEWDLASLGSGVADNYDHGVDSDLLRLLREMNRVRVATWSFVNPTQAEHQYGRQLLEDLEEY